MTNIRSKARRASWGVALSFLEMSAREEMGRGETQPPFRVNPMWTGKGEPHAGTSTRKILKYWSLEIVLASDMQQQVFKNRIFHWNPKGSTSTDF